jgi:uncharacterized protein (TIGR03435 family)
VALLAILLLVANLALHAQDAGPLPTFEVASIKPNKSGELRSTFSTLPGGRLSAANVPLRTLILEGYQVQDFQLAGGPGWMDSERFDVDARAWTEVGPVPRGSIGPMQRMMQSLLADRFALRAHRETRDLPIYRLVLARPNGERDSKLRTSGEQCAPVIMPAGLRPPPVMSAPAGAGTPQPCQSVSLPFFIAARRMSMSQLASGLSPRLGRMVVDRTGLAGDFDFDLMYTPDSTAPGQLIRFNGTDVDAGPSIFTALQEQLGLRLESRTGAVEVLVIDSVERPTPD